MHKLIGWGAASTIGAVALIVLVGVAPMPTAQAQCIINCKFSINGKKGRYLDKQVSVEALAKADAAVDGGLNDGRALGAVSINRGDYEGAGLAMPQTEAALNQLLAKIIVGWPYRATRPASVRLIGSTSYSPRAKPDNVIVVPLGMLLQADSDDEIAWVLAHEYGHIAMAHFSREAKQRRLTAGVDRAVSCARLGLALTEVRPRKVGDNVQFNTVEDKGMRAVSAQVLSKNEMISDFLDIYNQQTSRPQEDQADAVGLDLVLKSGFSDSGHGDALTRVEAEEKRRGTLIQQFARQFGSFAGKSGGAAGATMLKGGNVSDAGSTFLSGLLRNAVKLAQDQVLAMFKQSHRPAAKRREGLAKYMDAAYAADTFPEAQKSWLNAVRATAEFVEARKAVEAVDGANAALASFEPGDPADAAFQARAGPALLLALSRVAPALQTRYAKMPYVSNVMARLSADVGQKTDADRLWDQADKWPEANAVIAAPKRPVRKPRGKIKAVAAVPVVAPPLTQPVATRDRYVQQSTDGFRSHVQFLLGTNNLTKALSVVMLAKSRFGDDDKFLPELVAIYSRTSNKPMLLDAITRCAASQEPALQQRCTIALASTEDAKKLALLSPVESAIAYDKLNRASSDARMATSCGLSAPTATKATATADDD